MEKDPTQSVLKTAKPPPKKTQSKPPKGPKKGRSQKTVQDDKVKRCMTIQIFPSKDDKATLREWFGTTRYTYNMALDATERQGMSKNEFRLSDKFVIKKNVLKNGRLDPNVQEWLLNTPKHVRHGAIRDLKKAYTTEFSKCAADPKHHFQMKFKSKKNVSSIEIDSTFISVAGKYENDAENSFRLYPTFLKSPILYNLEQSNGIQIKYLKTIFRMSMTKTGKFYIHVPYEKPKSVVPGNVQGSESQGGLGKEPMGQMPKTTTNAKVASVDPGVSPFACIWSPTSNECYQAGWKDKFTLEKWVCEADRLLDLAQTFPIRNIRKRYRKVYNEHREKMMNKVLDMHKKVACFLVKNFDVILYPKFEIKSMVKKDFKRKIRKRTVRNLYNWNFYKFKKQLEYKAEECGKKLFLVSEAYTSKTCTHCGNLHGSLGGSKVYKCSECGVIYDRDIGGARNIFLRNENLL
jgi:IS605 OrfB family transposase